MACLRRPGTGLVIATLVAAGSLLAACSTVPTVDLADGHAKAADTKPLLVGAHGPLTEAQSKAILARLKRQGQDTDVLGRHLAFEEAITDTPLTIGNKVTLLTDGASTFAAMAKAIDGAKDNINLEYFTFEDVELDGQSIVDRLLAKQASGVQVNLIYDSIGSSGTPAPVFDRLRKAGIAILEFNPVNPLKAKGGYSLNDRDHRKILVADGKTAIIGGVNISKVYGSPLPGMKSDEKHAGQKPGGVYWRDTDIRIQGPAVADLQRLFFRHWQEQGGPALAPREYDPKPVAADHQVVRVIGSTPDQQPPYYYVTLLSAIRTAESRIWLTEAYFVPTHQELEDLVHAAKRGVDVQILLPSRSDSDAALNVGRSHYDDLLEAGVKIYEYQRGNLHCKTAVIDGVWSAIGSSNFDPRSVIYNDEVDAVILGRETGAQMEAMFKADLMRAKEITLAAWRDRPFDEKVREMLSRTWSNLL